MAKPDFSASEPISIPAGDDTPWNRWPGRVTAASILGVSQLVLRNMIQEGQLREYKAPDNSRRYNPEELDELSSTLATNRDSESAEATTRVGGVAVEGMKTAQDLLKQQQGHNERLLNLVINGFESSQKAMVAILERLASHNERLEQTHYDALAAADAMNAASRMADTDQALKISAEERRNQLVAAILPQIAPLLGNLTNAAQDWVQKRSTALTPAEPDPGLVARPKTELPIAPSADSVESVAEQAERLLRSVGSEKLELLANSGLLADEDSNLARGILERLKKEEVSSCEAITESHS